ncbi:MAG: hypothetical protein GWP12_01610 [Nitrospirae bacterium]|nr:hypothetical protein [Nitrospirota bacterium]
MIDPNFRFGSKSRSCTENSTKTEKEGIVEGESLSTESEDSLVHDIGKPDKKVLEDTLSEMGFHHIIRKNQS